MRQIVVVRFENERRASTSGEKIANVFPGIVSRRTEFGETEAAFFLAGEIVVIAGLQIEIRRAVRIADDDEVVTGRGRFLRDLA